MMNDNEENRRMRETLQNIVDADWRKWEELASPDEFVRWAKSRAKHALAPNAETSVLEVMHEQVERIGVLTDLLERALPYVSTNPDLHQHGGDELNNEIRAALTPNID